MLDGYDAADLGEEHGLIDVRPILDEGWLAEMYAPGWLEAAMTPTTSSELMAGVWTTYEPAQIVFYAAEEFEAA